MDIKEWLLSWFIKEKSISREELISKLKKNYFETGMLNSLAFVNLLVDIESTFNISLDNDDFAKDDFFSIEGTVNAIQNKLSLCNS